MTNIIEFPIQKTKSGFKKVHKEPEIRLNYTGQLNLFNQESPERNIFIMPSSLSPFEEALMLDEKGEQNAKEAYRIAIEKNDYIADAYCNLGILEFESGNTVKAIDSFTKSLKNDPRHFESHYNLANLYSELGNLPLAKTHYEFARELKPDFPDTCFNLGLVYAMSRDFESAIKILSEYKEMASSEDSTNAEKLIESIKKITGN